MVTLVPLKADQFDRLFTGAYCQCSGLFGGGSGAGQPFEPGFLSLWTALSHSMGTGNGRMFPDSNRWFRGGVGPRRDYAPDLWTHLESLDLVGVVWSGGHAD